MKVEQEVTRLREKGALGDAKAVHELLCFAWLGQLRFSKEGPSPKLNWGVSYGSGIAILHELSPI